MKCFAATLLILVICNASYADQTPYTREQWDRKNQLCARFLRTPQEVRDQIAQRQFDDDANTALHCAIRCTGILAGTYSDETGTVMEMMAVQAQGQTGFEEYRAVAEQCFAGFGAEDYGDDWCKKSYLYFKCDWSAWLANVKKVEIHSTLSTATLNAEFSC